MRKADSCTDNTSYTAKLADHLEAFADDGIRPDEWLLREWAAKLRASCGGPESESVASIKGWNAAIDAAVRIAEREWVGENSLMGSRVAGAIAKSIRQLRNECGATPSYSGRLCEDCPSPQRCSTNKFCSKVAHAG